MAQVIKGVFPERVQTEKKQDDEPVSSYILHIAITFSDPHIWRRVQVPGHYTLTELHNVLQASMGWSNSYFHQFLVGKICYEPTMKSSTLRESKRFDEHKYQLHTLEEGMQFMFSYIYDAGEGWEHEITLEETVPPTRELKHPILIAGEHACPPEGVGDVHQYMQLVSAMESPGNKDVNSLNELSGQSRFDPYFFDLEAARRRVKTLTGANLS